jgi:microcystin-dependent protein
MANVPLVANPLLPPVPEEPTDLPEKYQKTADQVWQWMKDLALQIKILLGSPQASNTILTATLVQAGSIIPFGGLAANIPSGYLACDGSVVSQTQYAALYAAISSLWNTGGEGAGNFRLPDLRGRMLLGAGQGAGLTNRLVAQTGGAEGQTLTVGQMPAHAHTITDPQHGHTISDPKHTHTTPSTSLQALGGGGQVADYLASSATKTIGASATGITINASPTGISVNNTGGGGGAVSVMSPFGVIQWMIKF